ncbi:MAG: ribonucleoside triphosphate reductase, partial [Desulfobulbaceae bacterium]|nr:ribonucleoside triphosphate reductase [Desulfobulbaceae bacterium]
VRIMNHMRGRLKEFQEETGNHYNLEATPAESTGYRLALLDQQRFPKIKCALRIEDDNQTPLYTNSTQLPVNYSEDIFKILDLQDPLQNLYTGGTVLHAFLGEAVPDPAAVKSFVRNVCDQYRLPYFTLTPSFSICPDHGYINGEQAKCPKCGSETEVFSRVVGYMRPVTQWNKGKRAEFNNRSSYRIAGAL